jgi:hypothetical protein
VETLKISTVLRALKSGDRLGEKMQAASLPAMVYPGTGGT